MDYQRKILPDIINYLDQPEVILLVGARQVGKTTVMRMLQAHLLASGVPELSVQYLDLEDTRSHALLEKGPEELLGWLGAHGVDLSGRVFLFIDEIQYLSNPSNLLKLLADHQPNLKLIVSGSSTLEIRRKFTDSLAGRRVVFEIYPLDFTEFLQFKGEDKLAEVVRNSQLRKTADEADPSRLPARFLAEECSRHFREFLIYGGYPRVALESDFDRKAKYLAELYSAYVRKDIKDLARIDNVTGFNNLIKALALQVGSLANITELCTAVRLARETVEHYLFLLENTFIIHGVLPFSRNARKEISKMRKYYFLDNGLRNVAAGSLAPLDGRTDAGELAENAVLSGLVKSSPLLEDIRFWRTLAKNEVDFVLAHEGKLRPIEVKYKAFRFPRIPAGIRSFCADYAEAVDPVVLTRDYFGSEGDTLFFPCWLA